MHMYQDEFKACSEYHAWVAIYVLLATAQGHDSNSLPEYQRHNYILKNNGAHVIQTDFGYL